MEPKTQSLICKSHSIEFIIIFVVGIITGLSFSFLFFKQTPQESPTDSNNSYQAGFDAARKLVEESSVGSAIKVPDDVRNFDGIVTVVEGNRITLHKQFSTNPFDNPALNDRVIIITNDTKITQLSAKDPEVLRAEMTEYFKKEISAASETPPGTFTNAPANINDIKTGVQISVTASENIKNLQEFSVNEVQIQSNQLLIN